MYLCPSMKGYGLGRQNPQIRLMEKFFMEILLFLINLQVIRIVQKKGRGVAKQ